MSTVGQLINDLTNLSSESKRKNNEVKRLCDLAIANLKTYLPTASINSINQELRASILDPLKVSCLSRNSKLATISIPIIHKLIMSLLVPVESLDELLRSLMDATQLAGDIQLRILQCLPPIMQNYLHFIEGDLLVKTLEICCGLTSNNKSVVVVNTASATLQQLFSNVFDRIKLTDSEVELNKDKEIKLEDEKVILVDSASYEAYAIFLDLCNLIENEQTIYLSNKIHIKPLSVLEIVENIIAGHRETFNSHEELSYLLRVKIVPSLLKVLNSHNKSFPYITRTMRIMQLLLSSHLDKLELESEIVLSFLNHILINKDSENELHETPNWEKILVLEVYKALFSDFSTIREIFDKYDGDAKKKNVIEELMSILNTYMLHIPNFIHENLVMPNTSSLKTNAKYTSTSNLIISRQTSVLKVSILDHLDKTEPPTQIPPSYPIFLILNILLSFTDEVGSFVSGLSNYPDSSRLEQDVEFVNKIIEISFENLSSLYKTFIYSSMDNECFHLLIRSLQKFIHTTGLLGLNDLRDRLLIMLSKTIIFDTSEKKYVSTNNSTSTLHEQGKQLLAIGESVLESISSSINSTDGQQNSNLSDNNAKYFNSRHVTCLRALINLAVSLGSTLENSWHIIWITLQWFNYYRNGSDDTYTVKSTTKTLDENFFRLSAQDIENIESSKKKLLESIYDYPIESFGDLLKALCTLSEKLFNNDFMIDKDNDLQLCPFNRAFYLSNIKSLCEINTSHFLIQYDEPWQLICDYFKKLCKNRIWNYNLRIKLIETFSLILQHMADSGFVTNQQDINNLTSKKSLEGLMMILDEIFSLGAPKELLVQNCEIEIHLLLLTTLHNFIDKYDTYYQNSWNQVFKILNTPFRNIEFEERENKTISLITSSFETLKLILDEFISTFPFDQLKFLIDTLYNFCNQPLELNISFTSVSYFWLISDSLKSRIISINEPLEPFSVSEEELINYIENCKEESTRFYISLDVFLLSSLIKLSKDTRAQVREGSIQTFFQIIEDHGGLLLQSWELIHSIALPILLDLDIGFDDPGFDRKEWKESLSLVLSGLVSIYNKYMMNLDNNSYERWGSLVNYFKKLLELKWVDLNLLIYKSIHDILVAFGECEFKEEETFSRIRNLFFELWGGISIEYDFVNPLYQESLVSLMECYPPLLKIISYNLTEEECTRILDSFNKCARYPILQDNISDNKKPSKLQLSILHNLQITDSDNNAIQAQMLLQLSNMIIYPFGTRARIEEKLHALSAKFKIPSFIAISDRSVDILQEKLEKFLNFEVLIKDKKANRIIKCLLEVIKARLYGIEGLNKPLWIRATEVLNYLLSRTISSEFGNNELWKLIIDSSRVYLENDSLKYEDTIIKQYSDLRSLILPELLKDSEKNLSLIEEVVSDVYHNSFFYKMDELETAFVQEYGDSIEDLGKKLSSYDFDSSFGSTKPIELYGNRKTRIQSLHDLIAFCTDNKNEVLREIALSFFITRASFALRKFISDQSLLFKCPLPKIQQQEILLILQGLHKIRSSSQHLKPDYFNLETLLIKLIPLVSKVNNVSDLLGEILEKKYTK